MKTFDISAVLKINGVRKIPVKCKKNPIMSGRIIP